MSRHIRLGVIGVATVGLLLALLNVYCPHNTEPALTHRISTQREPSDATGQLLGKDIEPRADRGSVGAITHVVSTSGGPVDNAFVTWTQCPSLGPYRGPDDPDTTRVVDSAYTANDGAFDLAPPYSSDSQYSVLWCSHPRYLARSFFSYEAIPTIPELIELSPAASPTVTVLDADGKPSPDATVIEAFDLEGVATEAVDPAACAFRREWKSDDLGSVSLHPIPGCARIWAEKGNLRSQTWTGSAAGRITLNLHSTFFAGGGVIPASGSFQAAGARVRCGLRRAMDFIDLGCVSVRTDTTWGPVMLPVIASEAYVFRLEGDTFQTEQLSTDPPRPGDRIRVDFHPTPGIVVTVHSVDDEGHSLSRTKVSVLWRREADWITLERTTDVQGIARFTGCPVGELFIRAQCVGLAPKRLEPIFLQSAPSEPIVIQLDRAGRLEGQCLHDLAPVESFTVVFWQSDPAQKDFRTFHGQTDGRFAIDEGPLGPLHLLAYSDDLPPSPTQVVGIVPDRTAQVTLSLPGIICGVGRVIDALTGEALPRAAIQVNVLHENIILKPWGSPVPVDTDGHFSVGGLVEGYNSISILAPGHAPYDVSRHVKPGDQVDFGTVGLFGTHSIVICLQSETPEQWTLASVELLGSHTYGPRSFSDVGRAVFPGLPPGPYTVRVFLRDANLFDSIQLRPDRDLTVIERLRGRPLDVFVIPEASTSLPEHLLLRASFLTSSGSQVCNTIDIPGSGHVQVGHVEGDHVILAVEDFDGTLYGCERVALGPIEPTTAQIHLGRRPLHIRVVDRARAPIPNVHVDVSIPGDRSGWLQQVTTDAEGLCSIAPALSSTLYVSLYHFSLGLQPSTLVDLGNSDLTPKELVLDPTLGLEILLLERQTPAARVDLWAEDSQGIVYGLGSASSNEEGIVTWAPVGKGGYRIEVHQPGYWPSSQEIRLDAEVAPIPIQVRRLGSAEFQANNGLGNALPDLEIEMRSTESGETLSEWLLDGRILAPPSGVRTNSEGYLRLDGLPNGPFHWRATSLNGDVLEGEVIVPPNGLGHADISIP